MINLAYNSGDQLTLLGLSANVATLISGMMDAVLFMIAIYTVYLTFVSNKIRVASFWESFSLWKSYTINFMVKNCSLKTIIINKINIVFDNKYRIRIATYSEPLILNPLHTVKVEMEEYTNMGKFNMQELCDLYAKKACFHLEIETVEMKTIYAKLKGAKKYKIKKKSNIEEICLFTSKVNNIVLKDEYVYMLSYSVGSNGKAETAFINNNGIISTHIFAFNTVPVEILSNEEEVKRCFEKSCEKYNIKLSILNLKKLGKYNDETKI